LVAALACTLALSACRSSQMAGEIGDSFFSKGGLAVRTEPSGAMVYINENRIGRSPLVESLQPGMYRVQAKKRGYEPKELWAEVPKGKTQEVLIRLEQQ
jgi:hypothetical protein